MIPQFLPGFWSISQYLEKLTPKFWKLATFQRALCYTYPTFKDPQKCQSEKTRKILDIFIFCLIWSLKIAFILVASNEVFTSLQHMTSKSYIWLSTFKATKTVLLHCITLGGTKKKNMPCQCCFKSRLTT